MREATGLNPIIVAHGYDEGATFIAGRHLTLADVRTHAPLAVQMPARIAVKGVPTDDWPFLYLRTGGIPWTYVTVFFLIAVTAVACVRRLFAASILFPRAVGCPVFLAERAVLPLL